MKYLIPNMDETISLRPEYLTSENDQNDKGEQEGNEFDEDFFIPELDFLNPKAAERISELQASSEFVAFRTYHDEFAEFLSDLNIRHFLPHEFLVMGGSHNSPRSDCRGLNALPPKELWSNLKPLASVLDEIRDQLGASVRLTSVYRNSRYNSCIPKSAKRSHHMAFHAADFKCSDGNPTSHWRDTVRQIRSSGLFKGGIGIYNTFVHVDTRGRNADWDKRR